MKPITIHRGRVACIDRDNIDTDQILPKQFMKRVERNGYEDFLFYDWRRTPEGKWDPEFVLNVPCNSGASILIAGRNFGCGSAREHAVWALSDYGIRVLIAPSYSKIFFLNCLNNGILPAVVEANDHAQLLAMTRGYRDQPFELLVDLFEQTIITPEQDRLRFSIDAAHRERLISGKEEIEITLGFAPKISEFEQRQQQELPWLWERDC
jgi:3-isopropylmalate/(R)-2-methylmalate dehydratase small subunit